MTDHNVNIIKGEIRGLTLPLVNALIKCTITICVAIVGGCVYIKTTMNDHERRLQAIETIVKPMPVQITQLEEWRKNVTAYYLPGKNIEK